MLRTRRRALLIVAVMGLAAGTIPAQADDATSVDVQVTDVSEGSVTVSGQVVYGSDALGPVTLSTDPAADADVSRAAFDIGDVTVEPNLGADQLVFTLKIHDGIVAPVERGPLTAYMVPIMNDGDDRWRWLGAGSAATNLSLADPGANVEWGMLCANETFSGTEAPGMICLQSIPTTMTSTEVRWVLPFWAMKPPIVPGSVLQSSSVYCEGPCSFTGLLPRGLTEPTVIDSAPPLQTYTVPGEVELGIAPATTPPGDVVFTSEAEVPASGAFTEAIEAPSAPGAYSVWARTCYGVDTCAIGSVDVQIS